MDILQVNKFFRVVGGSERYMFECSRMLEEQGHRVFDFSMQHPENRPSPTSEYFVSNIEYENTSMAYKLSTLGSTVGKTIYSFESKRKIEALLRARKPDLVHLHMISHQISPSILPVFRKHGIPVVQTCHEYKLVCPNYKLYIDRRHEICERCLGGAYRHAVYHRCIKNSLSASALAAAAMYFHKAAQIYERNIDLFICPSRFMADKLAQGGIPESKIRHLPNFINVDAYTPCYESKGYALYMGRLSEEKGIMTLLKAMRQVASTRLVVVGEGPKREEIEAYIDAHRIKNVSLVGYKGGDELKTVLRNAAFLVLPSEWYENSPMVILEAFASGKPVVAASIGGIPENIDDGETGFLYEPGNVRALVECINRMTGRSEICQIMGRKARRKVEALCNSHYAGLMALYREAGATC